MRARDRVHRWRGTWMRVRPRDAALRLGRRFDEAGTSSPKRPRAGPARRDRAVIDRQAAERGPQRLERQPEIEQRAEDHVARRPEKQSK